MISYKFLFSWLQTPQEFWLSQHTLKQEFLWYVLASEEDCPDHWHNYYERATNFPRSFTSRFLLYYLTNTSKMQYKKALLQKQWQRGLEMLLHCDLAIDHTKHSVFLHLLRNSLLLLANHSLRHFGLALVLLLFLSLFLLWIEEATLLKHIFSLWLFQLFSKSHF